MDEERSCQFNVGHVVASNFNDPTSWLTSARASLASRQLPSPAGITTSRVWVTDPQQLPLYRDSFGIRAHTATVEGVHPLGERFTLTPSLHFYTQGKADFYYDPVYDPAIGEPVPPGRPRLSPSDHRLSAFGAITVGRQLEWRIDSRWSADFRTLRATQQLAAGREWLGSGAPEGRHPANWLQPTF